ncbi:MAG: hypothetical protein GQ527_01790 [Bacteroidales bacterium]|nr:hypothetical protein [Bacteroidales bacterium]
MISKKLSLFGMWLFFHFLAGQLFAQPTPGDTGLGAASGNVVGGGADLGGSIWLWLIPAILYFAFKWRETLFQWYVDLK